MGKASSPLPRDAETQEPLAHLEDIHVDTALPVQERMRDYLNQIGNPYCFWCGTTQVRMRFAPGEADFCEKLQTYFLRMRR